MSYGPVHQGNVSKYFAAKGVYAPKITCFHLAGILGVCLVLNGEGQLSVAVVRPTLV